HSVQELLTNPQLCQFIPVAIPEAMAVQETRRLVQRLEELTIESRPIIVNMVVPPTDCGFCGARRYEQQQHLEALQAFGLGCITVPLFPGEIVGQGSLLDVGSAILADGHEPSRSREESARQAIPVSKGRM
ncbi:MAG: ArsA family ATPase, partial [Dehalococcoidia bacterium]